MEKLDKVYNFMIKKAVPGLKKAAMPIAKSIFCGVTSIEKKKEFLIKRIKNMSDWDLDQMIEKNCISGFAGVLIYNRKVKLEKVIDAINKMDDSKINELIMNS